MKLKIGDFPKHKINNALLEIVGNNPTNGAWRCRNLKTGHIVQYSEENLSEVKEFEIDLEEKQYEDVVILAEIHGVSPKAVLVLAISDWCDKYGR